MSKYKDELKEFPKEVVEKMLHYQELQGNKRNVTVFEKSHRPTRSRGGFTWSNTIEGYAFWNDVISNRNFPRFFERYPKTAYPKVMRVSANKKDIERNDGIFRVVFMEKNGKYLAWAGVETLEDAEKITESVPWRYAKDIPETITMTKAEIAEKLNLDNDYFKIEN